MPDDEKIELKGVRPSKNLTLEEKLQILHNVQEFFRQFPGLGEEVLKDRERQRQEEDRARAERNQFYFGHHI